MGDETNILTAQEKLSGRKAIVAQKFEGFHHIRCCVVPAVYEDSAAMLLDGINNTVPIVLAFSISTDMKVMCDYLSKRISNLSVLNHQIQPPLFIVGTYRNSFDGIKKLI